MWKEQGNSKSPLEYPMVIPCKIPKNAEISGKSFKFKISPPPHPTPINKGK